MIAFFFQVIFLISCHHSKDVNKKVNTRKENDTYILHSMSAGVLVDKSSLAVFKDSIITFTPTRFKNAKSYIKYSYTYDSVKANFKAGQLQEVSEESMKLLQQKFSSAPMYIHVLDKPNIRYSEIPSGVRMKLSKANSIAEKSRAYEYNNKYYFFSVDFSQLFIYNLKTDTLNTITIDRKFFEITNFFIFDLGNDNEAEIFIFHVGYIAREDAISYDVYSIKSN